MNNLPSVKIPNWVAPALRDLPDVPFVGKMSGNAIAQIGSQMSNSPDLHALPHIKHLNKVLIEQIGTLVEGKLPDTARAILYEARQARLVIEKAQMLASANSIKAVLHSEIVQNIAASNVKIGELQTALEASLNISQTVRSALTTKKINRIQSYISEIESQKQRLQTSLEGLV